MPIDLSDPEETGSLLVPAYGLSGINAEPIPELAASARIGPAENLEETYGILHRDHHYALPRGTARFLFGASALFNDAIGPFGERRVIRLREADRTMPRDAANVCLMVQGMRLCVRKRQGQADAFKGYAAWQAPSSGHRWISSVTTSDPAHGTCATKTVLCGRAGRGALFAPVGEGKARVLLLDFHVADRDPSSPDLLMVWASCGETHAGEFPQLDPRGERLSGAWRDLIAEASDGYASERGP